MRCITGLLIKEQKKKKCKKSLPLQPSWSRKAKERGRGIQPKENARSKIMLISNKSFFQIHTQQSDEKHIPTNNLGTEVVDVSLFSNRRSEPGSMGVLFKFQPDSVYSRFSSICKELESTGNPLLNFLLEILMPESTLNIKFSSNISIQMKLCS